MDDKPIRVLLVEDDADDALLVRLCLDEPDGMGLVFELDPAETLAEALRKLSAGRYDAALVDLGLPDTSGLESARAVLAAAPGMPLLVFTNSGAESVALEAMRLGAQDFMVKGSSDSRLLKRSIRYAIERKAVQAQRDEGIRRVEQLKAEISQRRHLDELKDQWIETLSHDLRSPLAVISAAVSELQAGGAGALSLKQKLLVGLAHRQTSRVVRLVIHLLDYLRLESGVVKADLHPVDTAEILRRVVADFSRAAAKRAVILEVELPSQPIGWRADPVLFEQMIVNLVDNALRFARARVLVRLSGGAEVVEVSVQDDGIGIPPEKHAVLFTRFSQLDRSKKDGYKGTGLGLAICKEIAAMHGGTIAVKSEAGRGTAFIVRLPVRVPLASAASA